MVEVFQFINSTISSFPVVLTLNGISLFTKTIIFALFSYHTIRNSKKMQGPWVYLIVVAIGAMVTDAAWVVSLFHKLFLVGYDFRPVMFFTRLAWAFIAIFHQSICLFIESLIDQNAKIKKSRVFLLCISGLLSCMWISIAILYRYEHQRPNIEYTLGSITSWYEFIIITFSMFWTYKRIKETNIPKILKKQVKIFIKAIVAPFVISDFIQMYPFSYVTSQMANNYAVVGVSSTLLTFGFYYAARKMMGLRFLNFKGHVQSPVKFNFIDGFKDILEQLSHTNNSNEIRHITKAFCKEAFDIQPSRTSLYIRNLNHDKEVEEASPVTATESIVENFISRHSNDCSIAKLLKDLQIFIHDEIAFSNFYDETDDRKEILHFLTQINADIFLPIYEKQIIIGYIIIERDARLNELYSNVERDEMVVFANYLGNIINLQQNQNIHAILENEKALREELYKKHQEINQYKESIHSFLRDSQQRKIGIIFYKNRRFIFGNKIATEMIDVNLNTQEGHPLVRELKELARQVDEYKSPQSIFSKDSSGRKLVFSALPNLEQNNIIITISYPEIGDIIKPQIDLLKNPSEWDYLLYLETTKSGQLINQLIPGSGEHLLNFKIDLLKTALSKKALLLEMAEEDLLPTVEILHHISLRESLHVLRLQSHEKNYDTAIKLFGINPIFGVQQEQPMLERLHNTGTLFIQNIHFLDPETQQHLTEFIKYGFYHVFKSDKKITSNVRIICSTSQNLQTLAQEGKFSKSLLHELKQTTISMPPLMTLPEDELNALAEGFSEQAIKIPTFKNLLELSERERSRLIHKRPLSLQDFKKMVQQALIDKSKKNLVYQETQFDPAYHISDPELIEAARMGKQALKNPKIMALLWDKFQKNQNKIAAFLDVNRSSVNRRCKEYDLK